MPFQGSLSVINALLISMALVTAIVIIALVLRVRRTHEPLRPKPEIAGVMGLIWFFNTLGIGALAPSTAYLTLRKLVPAHLIPPTIFVASAPFAALPAVFYIQLIKVDAGLLVACILASVGGVLFGAAISERMKPGLIKLIMGIGLLIAAFVMLLSNLGLLPAPGTAVSLPPVQFCIAVGACFVFASLLNVGIPFFAPVLITLLFLGLEPRAAFPIMAGAGAFLIPAAALRFIRRTEIDLRIMTSTTIGAIPGILIAAYLVKALPLTALKWMVIVIVLYAAAMLLKDITRRADSSRIPAPSI